MLIIAGTLFRLVTEKDLQPPQGGATNHSHSHTPSCTGLCADHMSLISAGLDKNTRLMEFLLRQSKEKAQSTMPSSNDTMHQTKKTKTSKSPFKPKAQRRSHKIAEELDHRVCLCSFHHLDFAVLSSHCSVWSVNI